MLFKIGFTAQHPESRKEPESPAPQAPAARPSVVQVRFEDGRRLAYYNDRFDLHPGDVVFVEGKLEGERGRVTDVNYNFKIRLADYKCVISVGDTALKGRFFGIEGCFVTFDPLAAPVERVRSWYLPPEKEDEFLSGSDDSAICLKTLEGLKVTPAIAQRGEAYFENGNVKYLCLDGTHGYALVTGTHTYEVEFTYRNGEIHALTCTCFCTGACKHEFAVLLQLRSLLKTIETDYAGEFARSGYFAALEKADMFRFAIDGGKPASFTL